MIIRLSHIGVDLRNIRKKSKLTQKALAIKCGLMFHTICKIERGESSPKLSTVNTIISVLQATEEYKKNVNENIEIVF